MCWTDVITRTLTINQIIQKPLPLAFMGSGIIDFGDEIRNRSKEVQEEILSLPE